MWIAQSFVFCRSSIISSYSSQFIQGVDQSFVNHSSLRSSCLSSFKHHWKIFSFIFIDWCSSLVDISHFHRTSLHGCVLASTMIDCLDHLLYVYHWSVGIVLLSIFFDRQWRRWAKIDRFRWHFLFSILSFPSWSIFTPHWPSAWSWILINKKLHTLKKNTDFNQSSCFSTRLKGKQIWHLSSYWRESVLLVD